MALSVDTERLYFEFPDVHAEAELSVTFHRTVRVPDDGNDYPLPPSLGRFPLRVVENRLALPVWQSEACWLKFDARCPFLVKVGAGNIDALTGAPWSDEPDFAVEDYFEVPEQPWLDGFVGPGGTVRQFVAMPLGSGYTVSEQLSDGPDAGHIRIVAVPMRAEYLRRRPKPAAQTTMFSFTSAPAGGMGLGAGGSITQRVAVPVEDHDAWAVRARSSVQIALVNSEQWHGLTGNPPPTEPPTAAEYAARGFPWFERYAEPPGRPEAPALTRVDSVTDVRARRNEEALRGNETVEVAETIRIRPERGRRT